MLFQDCIKPADIKCAINDSFGGRYESYFNDHELDKDQEERLNDFPDDQDAPNIKSITGIIWNKERLQKLYMIS